MAHDREPQPGASTELGLVPFRAGARAVDLVEALEDPLLVRRRHTDPVVGDEEPDRTLARLPADAHLTTGMAELHGVVRQVEQSLANAGTVGRHQVRRIGVSERTDRYLPPLGDRCDPLDDVGHDLARPDELEAQLAGSRLDGRQVEQLVDDLGQVVDLPLDLPREVGHRGRVADRSGGERLRQELHRRERRAQLVADVRHEIAADPFGAAQLGDVVQREHHAAVAGHDRVDREGPRPEWPELRLAVRGGAVAQCRARHGVEARRAEGSDEAHAGQLFGITVRQPRGLAAGARDPQPLVEDDEDVPAGLVEQRVERRAWIRRGRHHAGGWNA